MKAILEGIMYGVQYYDIEGSKYIKVAKLRIDSQKGDIFNVYTATGRKYGCEYDGMSIEDSIQALEEEITAENI